MAREGDNLEHHQYCMILVSALISKMEKSGIKVIKTAFQALSEYAQVIVFSILGEYVFFQSIFCHWTVNYFIYFVQNDPWFQWTAVLMKSDGSLKSIFLNLHQYLKSPSQEIRTMAVNFFCDIFRADSLSPHSNLQLRFPEGSLSTASARRKEIYEEVYTTLLEVYSVPVSKASITELTYLVIKIVIIYLWYYSPVCKQTR